MSHKVCWYSVSSPPSKFSLVPQGLKAWKLHFSDSLVIKVPLRFCYERKWRWDKGGTITPQWQAHGDKQTKAVNTEFCHTFPVIHLRIIFSIATGHGDSGNFIVIPVLPQKEFEGKITERKSHSYGILVNI